MRDYALSIQGHSTLSVPQGSAAVNSVYSPIFGDFSVATSTNFENQNSQLMFLTSHLIYLMILYLRQLLHLYLIYYL
jgi:hypothetical protein